MGKPVEPKPLEAALERNPDFPEQFALFKMRYPVWQKTVEIKVTPENPWESEFQKFRQYGSHSPPEEDKEDDDILLESENMSISSKNKL